MELTGDTTKALREHERKVGIVDAPEFTPAPGYGLIPITDLVEMPDGTVMHKDDVPRN